VIIKLTKTAKVGR